MKISVYLLAVLSATMATPTLENLQSQLPQVSVQLEIEKASNSQKGVPGNFLSKLSGGKIVEGDVLLFSRDPFLRVGSFFYF